ncbi:MAG: hypothetical protein AAB919_00275 [Patescibacteria group bacterium]
MLPRPSNEAITLAVQNSRWAWLAANLQPEHITAHDLYWAIYEGGYSSDPRIRIVAANYLATSNLHLNVVDRGAVAAWIKEELRDEARLLLSVALYKRGDRHPLVVQVFTEACEDAAVGELARKFKTAA